MERGDDVLAAAAGGYSVTRRPNYNSPTDPFYILTGVDAAGNSVSERCTNRELLEKWAHEHGVT